MTKRAVRIVALGLLLGAQALADPVRNPWTQPHVLRYAIADEPANLSPLLALSASSLALERLIFDTLTSYDTRAGRRVALLAQRVPSLANGDISRDGTRITYHLRRGVRWHDGMPFSSDDVRFTYEAIVDPHNTAMDRAGFDRVTRVDTPDAATIVFHFAKPYPPALDALFADGAWPYGVLPAHLLRGRPLDRADFFTHPIGTGPFAFAAWNRGQSITLIRNDRYFLGKPKLERVVVRLVPDPQTRLLLARSHEIDWYTEVPSSLVPQIAGIAGYKRYDVAQNRFTALAFNLTRPATADRNLRRAIAMAIDRPALVRTVMHGTALSARADLPPIVWKAPASNELAYDPKAAASLLDEAGWKRDASGMRAKAGKSLSLDFVVPIPSGELSAAALTIAGGLRAAGIHVHIRTFARSLYYAPAAEGGIMRKGDFDIAFSTWASGLDPDDSEVFGCAYRPPEGLNWARYCSPEMENAQRVALSSLDPAKRKAAYDRIEALVMRDVPQFVLWWPVNVQLVSDDLKNFNPNLVTETFGAHLWDI